MRDFSCEDCKKWVIDIKTGRRSTRAGKPQPRQPGAKTPCRICPRKSPQHAKELELSQRDIRTVHLYLQCRATQGASLNDRERSDPLLLRNMMAVDQVFRRHEGIQTASDFWVLMPRKK